MTTISVAMGTFNGAHYIERQLMDLAEQSQCPSELVITDDQSSDATHEIIERFAKRAPFSVRLYVNETRLGYRQNFLRAANLCTSDLVAFCDQDDRWSPNKLASVSQAFRARDVMMVHHNAIVSDGSKQIGLLRPAPLPSTTDALTGDPWAYALGFTETFRRELLDCSAHWEMSLDQWRGGNPMAHDQWFFFLASVFGRIVYIDEPLATYMQHGTNTHGWGKQSSFMTKLLSRIENDAEAYGRFRDAAKRRAQILDAIAQDGTKVFRDQARAGANFYRHVTAWYCARHALYSGRRIWDRARAFRHLKSASGYAATGVWSLGRAALVRDLLVGLPLAPYLHAKP